MLEPSEAQKRIRDHPDLDLLVTAPAGCGKTEAIALRVAGIIRRGQVPAPRRILVATFSNRARDNIAERLQAHCSPTELRSSVTVSNFHGLAARIFCAHANVIGLDPALQLPDSDWVADQCRQRRLDYDETGAVMSLLRDVKLQPLDDSEVMAALQRNGSTHAIEIEEQRVREGRLTYDDMLRVAELILANDAVASLYEAHFGAVIVDEFQDLTPQQLRVINRIGYQRTTYAGDLAQGIYGFAGARPEEIVAAIRSEVATEIPFAESHRSSPAVLRVVNALSEQTDSQELTCALPDSWPSGGFAGGIGYEDAYREAEGVTRFCKAVLSRVHHQRVAVIGRTRPRRRFVDTQIERSELTWHRWDDGMVDTDTARVLRSMLRQLDPIAYRAAADPHGFLQERAGLHDIQDPELRRPLIDALGWCYDLLAGGESPDSVRARIRVGDADSLLSLPGVHLLNAHQGKGQQFDWVVVIGLEDGCIPDFRSDDIQEEARTLSVMVSRARHGVLLTWAKKVPTNYGNLRLKQPSPFWQDLSGSFLGSDQVADWFRAANWSAIGSR